MNSSLEALDKKFVWHPFTSLEATLPPLLVNSAKGVYIHLADGRKIIDGVSSWWVNIHGHGNAYLAEAVYKQALSMEHIIFAGFTHAPAIQVAEQLLKLLPGEQQKMFFSDNGSTAVEVAIKMGMQYWYNQGINKTKIVALEGAYHGDTFGAMSVGDRNTFTEAFAKYLFEVSFISFPDVTHAQKALEQFESICSSGEVGIFIYEPLLQGSGGMRTYSVEVLDQLLKIAKAHEVVCIADEVMTGFGRTGKLFASDHVPSKPDIVALSKGLTGGMMPMGATTCNEKILGAFRHADKSKTLYHGHSYTANPLGCAAALASLDLLLDRSCEMNRKRIEGNHLRFAEEISSHPLVNKICLLGTVISFELNTGGPSSYFNNQRDFIYSFFLERNILLRPLGNIIYILPPYIISDEELAEIYAAIRELLEFLGKNHLEAN